MAAPTKFEILSAMMALQSRATPLLIASDSQKSSGQLPLARDSYRELVEVLRQQLAVAEWNNANFPQTPFDLLPIVQPLLNAELTLADVLEALGERQLAETLRDESIRLSEHYLPGAGAAERHRQRAQSLLAQSRYAEALVSLYDAADEFRSRGDVLQLASAVNNIAEVLQWLGDHERALSEAGRAAALLDDLLEGREPSDRDIAEALREQRWSVADQRAKLLQVWTGLEQTVAHASRRLGRLDEAEAHFRKLLEKVPGDVRAAIEFQLAVVRAERAEHREALAEFQRLERAFVGLMRPKLGVLHSWKAETLIGLGQPHEAQGQAALAIRELTEYHDTDSLWRAQWRSARASRGLDRNQDALDTYIEAARTVDDLRKVPLGYRLDSAYMADKLPLFEEAIALASELNQPEKGCRLIELVKSRALTAILAAARAGAVAGSSDVHPELDREFDTLSQEVDAIEYCAYREGWTEDVERRRAELLARRGELLERLRFSDPRWRSLSAPPPFDLEELLGVLAGRRQAALTLFSRPGEVVAVLLQDGRCRIAAQPLSVETAAALRAYQENLQAKHAIEAQFDPATFEELSADRLMPAAFLETLDSQSLIVVPHGVLHLLPWAALVFRGQRLFERMPVGVLPNLTCVRTLQMTPNSAPRIALIGAPALGGPGMPDLPLAEAELRTLPDVYGSRARLIDCVAVGADATESAFHSLARHEAAKGAILHIACHGVFETGEPFNSGLLLSHGRLDAAEIARTRLLFDEVVLSACSTGYRPTTVQGLPLHGDDVLGLPGAFLEAGVRSLLVSIPKARDDATLQFMTLYHEQRASGAPPLASLRATQRAMLDDSRYPPFLWAGFTVYGCS